MIGLRRFDDLKTGDDRRIDIREVDSAPTISRPDSRRSVKLNKVLVRPPDLNARADAFRARDLNAGDVLKNFRKVLIRQLTNIFLKDNFDSTVGFALLNKGIF